MENFVVGLFASYDQAKLAAEELERAGFNPANVQLSPEVQNASTGQDGAGTAMPGDAGAAGGNCVLSVDAGSDDRREQAVGILGRHQPLELGERAGHWTSDGWAEDDAWSTGSGARRAAGEGASPPAGR